MEVLVINADNGCESGGSRSQWIRRFVEFSNDQGIRVQIACCPPYHSKCNPGERGWGVLANYWRGELPESIEKVVGLACSMTCAGVKLAVKLAQKVYQNGVKVAKCDMEKIEAKMRFVKNTPEDSG